MEHTERLTDAELHKGQPSHAATLAVSAPRPSPYSDAPARPRSPAPSPAPRELAAPPEAATELVPRGELPYGATAPASRQRDDEAALSPGTRIARYRIVSKLGAGGFGVVYRAHDPQLDREVALKLLHQGAGDSDARARLLREARAAAKIRHPNVVNVFDADEVDGRVFIAMELIDGTSLRAWMAAPRPWREVLDVFLKAGEGLCAAHEVGLVHRDFKPDNVLIEHSGRVRVLDFGLARPAFSEEPRDEAAPATAETMAAGAVSDLLSSALTHSGLLLGTPAYMAPEQFHHRPLDARMDQFSFCVALYEGLHGVRPFTGENLAQIMQNIESGSYAEALTPREPLPAALVQALTRGLAARPEDRHESMRALLGSLVGARAALDSARATTQSRRGLAVIAGLALVLAVVGARALSSSPQDAAQAAASAASTLDEADSASDQDRARGSVSDPPAPPPRLEHAPPAASCDGPLRFEATIHDGAPEATVWLHWRREGAEEFTRAAMKPGPTDAPQVELELPLAQHRGGTVEYYLEARDGAEQQLVTRGDPLALIRVEQECASTSAASAKSAKPPASRWCFRNTNMGGDKKCHKTRRACVKDADNWLGAGTGKRHCRGER